MRQTRDYKGICVLEDDFALERACKHDHLNNIEEYQKGHLEKAMKFCRKKRTAIDIGANYGIMTLNMSSVFERVYAFEIDPDVYGCLEKNVETWGLHNVETFPFGIGEGDKTVGLNVRRGASFGTHVDEKGSGIIVKPLDSFHFDSVDFIKIDAEGYEPLIIQGAIKTIERHKPIILYERKGHEERYGYTRSTVLKMLKPLGYKDVASADRKNGIIGVR